LRNFRHVDDSHNRVRLHVVDNLFDAFLIHLRRRHIGNLLHAHLRGSLCHLDDFLCRLWRRDVDDLPDDFLIRLCRRHIGNLLCALLWGSLCLLADFRGRQRHRDVDDLRDGYLSVLRHRHICDLLTRAQLRTFMRNDLCHLNDLLHYLRDRDINNLLVSAMLNTVLGSDRRGLLDRHGTGAGTTSSLGGRDGFHEQMLHWLACPSHTRKTWQA